MRSCAIRSNNGRKQKVPPNNVLAIHVSPFLHILPSVSPSLLFHPYYPATCLSLHVCFVTTQCDILIKILCLLVWSLSLKPWTRCPIWLFELSQEPVHVAVFSRNLSVWLITSFTDLKTDTHWLFEPKLKTLFAFLSKNRIYLFVWSKAMTPIWLLAISTKYFLFGYWAQFSFQLFALMIIFLLRDNWPLIWNKQCLIQST